MPEENGAQANQDAGKDESTSNPKAEEISSNLSVALREEREKTRALQEKLDALNTAKPSESSGKISEEDIDKVLRLRELKSKYNGSNGLPEFNPDELKEYAKENGIDWERADREKVYKLKYENELLDYQKREMLQRNQGVYKPADGKANPTGTFHQSLREAKTVEQVEELLRKSKN